MYAVPDSSVYIGIGGFVKPGQAFQIKHLTDIRYEEVGRTEIQETVGKMVCVVQCY